MSTLTRDSAIFERRMAEFLRNFAPNDPEARQRFELDLLMLVRQIYLDAQEPLLAQITRMMNLVPMPEFRVHDAPSGTGSLPLSPGVQTSGAQSPTK